MHDQVLSIAPIQHRKVIKMIARRNHRVRADGMLASYLSHDTSLVD